MHKFIDLFSGCGGLSEGFMQEGFEPLCHVDYDKPSCDTISNRLRFKGVSYEEIEKSVVCGDLTSSDTHASLINVIGQKCVDIVIGGPPCQAFSSVGRARDPFSMRNDPRNYLFKCYMEILEKYKPKIFVFENVSGLLSARPNGNLILSEILADMGQNYSVCNDRDVILLNSVHYGVPQIRKRVILIGVRKDLNLNVRDVYAAIKKTHYSPEMEAEGVKNGLKKYVTVRDAIFDLPILKPGEGKDEIDYSLEEDQSNEYLRLIRKGAPRILWNHVARRHNEDDQSRYRILSKNNWQLRDLAKVRPDLIHHDPNHFGNRYTVQEFDKPGRTVVAHLYKDGNLFIHPDHKQQRTFTVREAARIQSFPDNFRFLGSRTNQYKQVGNAVPPLMARAIAKTIKGII